MPLLLLLLLRILELQGTIDIGLSTRGVCTTVPYSSQHTFASSIGITDSTLTRMIISRTRIAAKSTNRSTLQSRQDLKLLCCLVSLALWEQAIAEAPQALHRLAERQAACSDDGHLTLWHFQAHECMALQCYANWYFLSSRAASGPTCAGCDLRPHCWPSRLSAQSNSMSKLLLL